MNIILVGPPGAGKGTQAVKIAKETDLPHISTGDIFREAVGNETSLGLEAKSFMDKGELVPDEIVIGIVEERLLKDDTKNGFILDGFPRTLPQAESLDVALGNKGKKIDLVLEISVEDEELVNRLSGRRVCKSCGASYHVMFNPPAEESICDSCDGEVYQRSDDEEATIKNRLSVYKDQTEPLVDYYLDKGLLKKINGAENIDIVTQKMINTIRVNSGDL